MSAPTGALRPVDDPAALVAASGHDPFVRWMLDPSEPLRGWAWPGGVAWQRATPSHGTSLTVLAPPGPAAERLPELLSAAGQPERVTVPFGTLDLLPSSLTARVVRGDDWEWMLTEVPPPAPDATVERLGPADEPLVAELLAAASPRHSTAVGDPDVVGWWGVRDPADGRRLAACAAHTEAIRGVPHLASIATHPDARGHGLGAAVTAAVTRAAFDLGRPVVTLGMYSDNAVARRLYHRLGFRCDHRWSSRRLAPLTP